MVLYKKVYFPALFLDVCATWKENGCTTWVSVCVSVPFIIHGQWLSWSVPPISQAFVWHRRYKKVWINMKSRCGCLQNGTLYSCNFFWLIQLHTTQKFQRKITCVIPIRGRDRMSNSALPKLHCLQCMTCVAAIMHGWISHKHWQCIGARIGGMYRWAHQDRWWRLGLRWAHSFFDHVAMHTPLYVSPVFE